MAQIRTSSIPGYIVYTSFWRSKLTLWPVYPQKSSSKTITIYHSSICTPHKTPLQNRISANKGGVVYSGMASAISSHGSRNLWIVRQSWWLFSWLHETIFVTREVNVFSWPARYAEAIPKYILLGVVGLRCLFDKKISEFLESSIFFLSRWRKILLNSFLFSKL